MRSILVLLSVSITFVQPSWAKAPVDCAALLQTHVEAQPKFLPWHQLWDAFDERGDVTFVLKVDHAKNTRDARDLSLPFHRTMRVLAPFTVEDQEHSYYLATGDAWDWQLYAADLDRDLGSPKFQILTADHDLQKSSLLHELLNRAWWTAYPVKTLTNWLKEKSKTYAAVAKWSDERTAGWAARLRARRLPQVPVEASLLNRVREVAAPFSGYAKLPVEEFMRILGFLERLNPRKSAAAPGDLSQMFVNVMDKLDPALHEEHVMAVAALDLSPADAEHLDDEASQLKLLNGLRLVHDVVKLKSPVPWKRVETYDHAFIGSVLSTVKSMLGRRKAAPLRMTLDEWNEKQFGAVFFDPHYAQWSYNQVATVITDEATQRAWAVINQTRVRSHQDLVELLSSLTDQPLPAPALRYLEMTEAIPTGEPAQLSGPLGHRLLDWAAYFKSVARIETEGNVNDLLIVPLR